jgi:hypothetical protein
MFCILKLDFRGQPVFFNDNVDLQLVRATIPADIVIFLEVGYA